MKHTKEELTNKIIEFLKNNNIDIDNNTNVFAGGALGNLIFALENNCEPFINDIDLFEFDSLEKRLAKQQKLINYNGHVITGTTFSVSGVTYNPNLGNYFQIAVVSEVIPENYFNTKNFFIDKCYYNNNINLIKLNNLNGPKPQIECINLLLEDFDLNCVKVAFDIQTKTLYLTDDFLDFLKTKEIKIINKNKLFKSLLRAFKKSEQLNLNCKEKLFETHQNYFDYFQHNVLLNDELFKLLFNNKEFFDSYDFNIEFNINTLLWEVSLKPITTLIVDCKNVDYTLDISSKENVFNHLIENNQKINKKTFFFIKKYNITNIELVLLINDIILNDVDDKIYIDFLKSKNLNELKTKILNETKRLQHSV
jgi:hypothetical protein